MTLSNTRTLLSAAALLAALATPVLANAQPYDLDVEHDASVGDRYAIDAETYAVHRNVSTYGDEAPVEQSASHEISLRGEIEYLAVDEDGDPSQIALSVVRYDMEIDDQDVEMDITKRIIITRGEEMNDYRYDGGGVLPDDAVYLLEQLFNDMVSSDTDEEDARELAMFGIDVPRSPGEAWAFDAGQMLSDFTESGDPADFPSAGTVNENEINFVELNTREFGEDTAVIEYDLEIEAFDVGGEDFPEFLKIQESSLEFTGEIWIPLSGETDQTRVEFEMEMVYNSAGTVPGENVELTIVSEGGFGLSATLRRID